MRHHGNEIPLRDIPSPKLTFRARAPCVPCVLLHKASKSFALTRFCDFLQVHHCRVALALELAEFVENKRDAATHSGSEVSSGAPKHDNHSACHVLTSVIAHTFD